MSMAPVSVCARAGHSGVNQARVSSRAQVLDLICIQDPPSKHYHERTGSCLKGGSNGAGGPTGCPAALKSGIMICRRGTRYEARSGSVGGPGDLGGGCCSSRNVEQVIREGKIGRLDAVVRWQDLERLDARGQGGVEREGWR